MVSYRVKFLVRDSSGKDQSKFTELVLSLDAENDKKAATEVARFMKENNFAKGLGAVLLGAWWTRLAWGTSHDTFALGCGE